MAMTPVQRLGSQIAAAGVIVLIVLIGYRANLEQQLDDVLAKLSYQEAAITCPITETFSAIIQVAIPLETNLDGDEGRLLRERICGILNQEETLILKITYEGVK